MALENEFRKQGDLLFRWRSYFPLIFLAIVIFSIWQADYAAYVRPSRQSWKIFCLVVAFSGQFVRVLTVGFVPRHTSGRNTREQKAEYLNTSGIYSTVRHPLYLGNFLAGLGAALFPGIWWLTMIYVLSFWIYYERIMYAEESFLRGKFGDEYTEWADRTPAFLPRISQYRKPALSFSIRTVLRREYPGFFAIIFVFTMFEVLEILFATGTFGLERFWLWLFVGGLAVYLTLLTLKRKTKLLKISGR